jgi:leader peptidase (prepilin peptidase)/N-methyltransferase
MDIRFALIVLVHAALIGVAACLVVVDARTHRLPNRIVLPTLGSLLVLVAIDALAAWQGRSFVRALLGLVILGSFYAVLRAISRAGMGGGDVKLAAVIGLVLGWHGWQAFVIGAAAAFVLGALYALVLILLHRANGTTRIAFGPWMIAGALLGIALG